MSVDIVRSCTDHDDSHNCRCCILVSLPRVLITAQLRWVCSWCEISGRQTDRRISSILYHSLNWPYQEQRSPSRMFVEDRNLLPGKILSRRIQAVNRGDLGFTTNTNVTWSVAFMCAGKNYPSHCRWCWILWWSMSVDITRSCVDDDVSQHCRWCCVDVSSENAHDCSAQISGLWCHPKNKQSMRRWWVCS